jgi:RNA polymerase sigma factor (sigma-70 family)
MHDKPTVEALVLAARDGDREAWNTIVERYGPLVFGVCVSYRLAPADIEDVGQAVWLLLFQRLHTLRVPEALPGWLLTTTRNECKRVVGEQVRRNRHGRALVVDPPVDGGQVDLEEQWERVRRNAALREAFVQLDPPCRDLLSLLFADPPIPYREIARQLRMKVGSIGPTRARCLDHLRRCPALAALIAERADGHGGGSHA